MPTSQSFTTTYAGRAIVLTTQCWLAPAFDPSSAADAPELHQFNAIWDTGATNTSITQDVVDRLGLVPTGMVEVHGAHGSARVPTYLVNVALPNKVNFVGLKVSQVVLTPGVDILIGMDIIGSGDFAVSMKDGVTIMSYRHPCSKSIDFVAEHASDQFKESTRALIRDRPESAKNGRKNAKRKGKRR